MPSYRWGVSALVFLTALGVSGLVSASLAVEPGRAAAALFGVILSMTLGLVYGPALERRQPGWFLEIYGSQSWQP